MNTANRNWSAADMPDQQGRVAIVTGANSGLGYETALALAAKGARVIMTARSMAKGNAAKAKILQQVPQAELEVMVLDLASLELIRSFTEAFKASHERLESAD